MIIILLKLYYNCNSVFLMVFSIVLGKDISSWEDKKLLKADK